jgi:hypothetical protein
MTPFAAPGPGASSCGPLATISGDGGVTGPTDARPPGTGGASGTGGSSAGTGGRAGGAGGATGAGGSATGTGGAAAGTGGAAGAKGGGETGASGGCSCDSAGATSTLARAIDLAAVLLISMTLIILRRRSRRGRS